MIFVFFFSATFVISEDDMKTHFKAKHKISTVKPFLVKRICRICDQSNFNTNDDLAKHIEADHPKSSFCEEEEGNVILIKILDRESASIAYGNNIKWFL